MICSESMFTVCIFFLCNAQGRILLWRPPTAALVVCAQGWGFLQEKSRLSMVLLKHIPLESELENSPLNWKMYNDLDLCLSPTPFLPPPLSLSALSPSLPFSLTHSSISLFVHTHRSLVIRCVALVMSMVWRRAGLGGVAGSTLSSSSTLPWSMDLQGSFVHSMYRSDLHVIYFWIRLSQWCINVTSILLFISFASIVAIMCFSSCLFSICLTKLDILDTFDEIKIGVAYKLDGKVLNSVPGQYNYTCRPILPFFSL